MATIMDTLSVFEQFRAVLGDDKAKVFAQTLGTMIDEAKNTATKDDIRQLRESLDSNVSRLDAALATLAEAQARTEGRFETLVVRVDALAEGLETLTARVDKLAEGLETLTARVDALAEGLATLTARVDKLAEGLETLTARVDALTQQVDKLTAVVDKLVIRSDRHEGTLLELKFRDRLPSYLGRYLRRAKVLQAADLLDEIEPRLESAEVDDFLRADVLATGAVDGVATYVVGEVSYTADASDVERAARRAALLRKAKFPAVGLVACEATHPQTIAYAREQGVRMWIKGVLVDEKPPRHE